MYIVCRADAPRTIFEHTGNSQSHEQHSLVTYENNNLGHTNGAPHHVLVSIHGSTSCKNDPQTICETADENGNNLINTTSSLITPRYGNKSALDEDVLSEANKINVKKNSNEHNALLQTVNPQAYVAQHGTR